MNWNFFGISSSCFLLFFAPLRVSSSFWIFSWWFFFRVEILLAFKVHILRKRSFRNVFRVVLFFVVVVFFWFYDDAFATIENRLVRDPLEIHPNFVFIIIRLLLRHTQETLLDFVLDIFATCVQSLHTHAIISKVSVSMSPHEKDCRALAKNQQQIFEFYFHSTSSLPLFVEHNSSFSVWGYHVHNNNMTPSPNGT